MRLIAAYLMRLANWLDPPHALTAHVTCDASQAIASLDAFQADLQKTFERIKAFERMSAGVTCKKE